MNNNQQKKGGAAAVASRASSKKVGAGAGGYSKQNSSVQQSIQGMPSSQLVKPASRTSSVNGGFPGQGMMMGQGGQDPTIGGGLPSQMNSFYGGDQMLAGGERVRVAIRVRPMMSFEIGRGDDNIITAPDNMHVLMSLKSGTKSYRFNAVLDDKAKQSDVFNQCGVHELIDSALEGYSATIFAYGQTGSGKTYTMSGVEDKLGREGWTSDENDGLFPRSVRYMWERMTQQPQQFYVKASFLEIYNEQLRDLLNPSSGILHHRWNAKNGFFVEDLMVVECTSQQDLIAVLHEGMKNRKSGSHELNKDSSRSHSILTVYLISETVSQEDGHIFKKYGKMSFVDLAGSERLKESKSQGDMVKETGQINKSLFTLGKVISMLSSEKNASKLNQKYIPYRDSKLTMLLMDSLGGTSKALMIACISPSHMWAEETISTLNYATRTMNIKNKPIIQMDAKEQIIYNLKREIHLLKLENEYLKEQIYRLNGGKPIQLPTGLQLEQQYKIDSGDSTQFILPPIGQGAGQQFSQSQFMGGGGSVGGGGAGQGIGGGFSSNFKGMDYTGGGGGAGGPEGGFRMLQEFEYEIGRLREENSQLRYQKELTERDFENVIFENNTLYGKLENLENVFIGSAIQREGIVSSSSKLSQDYTTSTLMLENTELKKKIARLEEEKLELKQALISMDRNGGGNMMGPASMMNNGGLADMNEVFQLRQSNAELQKRVEFLQKRERELMDGLIKSKQRQ